MIFLSLSEGEHTSSLCWCCCDWRNRTWPRSWVPVASTTLTTTIEASRRAPWRRRRRRRTGIGSVSTGVCLSCQWLITQLSCDLYGQRWHTSPGGRRRKLLSIHSDHRLIIIMIIILIPCLSPRKAAGYLPLLTHVIIETQVFVVKTENLIYI